MHDDESSGQVCKNVSVDVFKLRITVLGICSPC